MKKFIFLVISLFIISGCEAVYTIDVDDDYNENLTLKPTTTSDVERFSRGTYKYPAYYDPNFMEDEEEKPLDVIRYNYLNENSIITYSYKFNGRYNDSNIPNLSVGYFGSTYSTDYRKTANIVARNFAKIFKTYPGLTKLTINVKVGKNVISSNADLVNGNVYTWYVTKNNADREISIYFENDKYYSYVDDSNKDKYEKNSSNNIVPNNKENNNNNKSSSFSAKTNKVILYVLYSLFFGLIFVIIVFRKKFRK